MEIGASVGPYLDRIESLPSSLSFVEFALGEGERPLAAFDPEATAALLAEQGFGGVVHLPYRQPLSTPVDRLDAATAAYLDDVLATAATAGADAAVAHPSARGAGNEFDRLATRVADLAARGREHGVPVRLETTGYAGGPALETVGRLADEADAAVCLDLGYAYLESGTDGVESFLDAYCDLVAHLHVHGARRRGDTHIPVGSGDVDHATLGPAVAAAAPDATVTVEVFTDDVDYLAASAERFRATLPDADAPG
jgi:sugar phosphate isomerase/epimerase